MRDYSQNRDPFGRPIAWYENWIACVAFAIIMVIGPPILWVLDRVDNILDRVWPNRPKRPAGRIP